MIPNLNNIINNIIKSDKIVYTFLRSIFASLCSALVDFGTRILAFSIIFASLTDYYRSNISVALGAILGGIINCIINYKVTFHAIGQDKVGVSIKFFICWAGNLLLNMYGTTFLLIHLSRYVLQKSYGITEDEIFTVTTVSVAIMVSIFWNFTMQRYFVYRYTFFDRLLHIKKR